MRERTEVRDLAGRVGARVRVCGWVEAIGDGVVVLRDHSGLVALRMPPAVVPAGTPPPAAPAGTALEEAIEATGTVVAADAGVTVVVDQLRRLGPVLAPLPLAPDATLDQRLDWRFLDLRRPENRLIFEVQTTAEQAMREYWGDHGFLELHSPKFRPNPNRTGRELFRVPYFDRTAYLVQSPQFYKQMAMAAGFERVFEIGPVFRANPNATYRHDTEFTSVDVEMSWIDSDDDVMAFEEGWLRHVIAAVEARHGEAIAKAFGVTVTVPDLPFPRVSLADARGIAEAAPGGGHQPEGDIDAVGEAALGRHVRAERGHEFVFVVDYPCHQRPFYHMRRSDGSELTRGFDLLWNGLEVTTGSQREHRYDRLVRQAAEDGIPEEPIRYYLDCFRFGCPPHGGFGLGLTRALMALLGKADVREVTYLFRGPDRLSP